MKRTGFIVFILFLVLKAPATYAQDETFEALFKTAFECQSCTDSMRIALFTAAIDYGTSDPGDFDNFTNALINRGTLRTENGDYPGAISDFNRAIGITPDSDSAIQKLGSAYLQNGEYDKAIEQFDKFINHIEIEKQEALLQFPLSSSQKTDSSSLNLNQLRNQIQMEMDDRLAIGYNNRAIAKAHLNNREGACVDFRKAYNYGITELKEFIEKVCN